jgi:rod shape-determining protein MreD
MQINTATTGPRIRGWIIPVTFAIALLLMAMPLPVWAVPYRPDWVGIVLIYWCIAVPHRVGPGVGWSVGIVMDVMQFTLLGQNALAKTVLAFLANQSHLRIRMYPLWQQCAVVFLLLSIDTGLVMWVHGVANNIRVGWLAWWPAATSMLVWPWLFIIMRDARRRSYIR